MHAILVDGGGGGLQYALFLVLFGDDDGAGDGVADVDGGGIVEVHFGGEEADHTADVGDHACGEQTGDDAPPEEAALGEGVVEVVGDVVVGDAAEVRDVACGEGAAEDEGLADVGGVDGGL